MRPFLLLSLPRFHLFSKFRQSPASPWKPSLIVPPVGRENIPCAPIQAQPFPLLIMLQYRLFVYLFPIRHGTSGAGILSRSLSGSQQPVGHALCRSQQGP